MKHIKMYEFFHFGASTARLIIVEGAEPFAPETQDRIDAMEESGELTMVDMSTCDEAAIQEAVASPAKKVLFMNGDDCDRAIRYAVMDLHPEIIPATDLTPADLETEA